MKIQITMKTPDAVTNALEYTDFSYIPEENRDSESERIYKLCKKWFQYGECVTLEVDTEKETCVVLG